MDLDPDLIREQVAHPWLRMVQVYREIGSTNARVLELGEAGEAEGIAILADTQTAGRGQFGRRWHSAAGLGLWMSLLLRTSAGRNDFEGWTHRFALAVAATLSPELPVAPRIKPPNDLLFDGRKACGILIEARLKRQEGFAALGIGLNVNHSSDDFPRELRDSATSLRQVAGREFDRQTVAVALLRSVTDAWLSASK